MQLLKNLNKLNLCSGLTRYEDYTNVDKHKTSYTDMVVNLEQVPWPFETSSVDEVNLTHVLEHITNQISFMNELYRIMAPNGKVYYRGPHARSSGAWQDPTHTRPLPEEWFTYFDGDFRYIQGIVYSGINTHFKISNESYILHPDYSKWLKEGLTQEQLRFDLIHKFNVATDFICLLTAIK